MRNGSWEAAARNEDKADNRIGYTTHDPSSAYSMINRSVPVRCKCMLLLVIGWISFFEF